VGEEKTGDYRTEDAEFEAKSFDSSSNYYQQQVERLHFV
jgi:hypothetical protein